MRHVGAFDYVIVGAGTASVLLLEASGKDAARTLGGSPSTNGIS
jgi:hypothetical protein